MNSKKNNSNLPTKLNYEEILEEEIISSYENKYGADVYLKNKKINKLKKTLLEIINRCLFFSFVGSFIFSFIFAYTENKIWFTLYIISAFSCIFYTPNRKALKELIAAWPNIEDLIKGRSLWRKDNQIMNPIKSFKKWLLNILVPYIEESKKTKEKKE